MAALVTTNELEKILRALLDKMEKQGVAGGIKNKDALIKMTAQKIFAARGNLTSDNLKDLQFQKLLRVALVSQHIQNTNPNKNLHFDFAKLFDKNLLLRMDPKKAKDFEKNLEKTFKFLLTKLNQIQPNKQLSDKRIDQLAKELSKSTVNKLFEKALSKGPSNSLSTRDIAETVESDVDKTMRELCAGMKPNLAGSIPFIVYRITGNLQGIADQQGGNEQSFAFLDEVNRFDSNKTDPIGIENQNFQRLVSLNGEEIDNILSNREDKTQQHMHNPLSTMLVPPDQKTKG